MPRCDRCDTKVNFLDRHNSAKSIVEAGLQDCRRSRMGGSCEVFVSFIVFYSLGALALSRYCSNCEAEFPVEALWLLSQLSKRKKPQSISFEVILTGPVRSMVVLFEFVLVKPMLG
ncbi:hypothetical protein Droror1_Dr00021495 [Drosera rotundifolia]